MEPPQPRSNLGRTELDGGEHFSRDLRMRYMVSYDMPWRARRTSSVPSFEIWLHTPTSNVASASVHSAPIRPLAIPMFILATVLGGAALATLPVKDHSNRDAAFGVLGGLSIAFVTGGTLLVSLPATDRPIDMGR